MWILVSKLDSTATCDELQRFIAKGLSPGLSFLRLPSRGQIRRCEIQRVLNQDTNTIVYYGLVLIEPVKSALAVISRLNGSKFKGHPVRVKKYQRRASPDRRDNLQDRRGADGEERRKRERRRTRIVPSS